MNLFKFDTSKMTWAKTTITGTGTSIISITFTDQEYFKELQDLFLNLRNIKFKFVLTEKAGGNSYMFGDVHIVGWDYINDSPKLNSITYSTFKINIQLLVPTNLLTNLTDYWLYLQYE